MRLRPGICPGPHRGSSRRSPRPSIRLRRGHPFPNPTPLGAFGGSTLAPPALGSAPRTHNVWLRHCSYVQCITAPAVRCMSFPPRPVLAAQNSNPWYVRRLQRPTRTRHFEVVGVVFPTIVVCLRMKWVQHLLTK